MIKIVKPLPVSEETLGAYIEGNLNQEDAHYIENLLKYDADFEEFVNNISVADIDTGETIYDSHPDFDMEFKLPEVPLSFDVPLEINTCSFEFEPSLLEVVDYAVMPEVADDEGTIDLSLDGDEFGEENSQDTIDGNDDVSSFNEDL